MLDVMAGAMGVFLSIAVILLPYYKKDVVAQIEQLEQQLSDAQAQMEAARDSLQNAQRGSAPPDNCIDPAGCPDCPDCQPKRASLGGLPFMLVKIAWATQDHDVDLHIVDPAGKEFYFSHKTVTDRPGMMSHDDTDGPGEEMWLIPAPPPEGIYEIMINLYDRHGNLSPAPVNGAFAWAQGETRLNTVLLDAEDQKVLMAKLIVDSNGDARIEHP